MQNVILVIHLLIALSLIAVVLLQRSEGGGLGIGGGMGPQGGRPPLTGLAKVTWGLAICFITTSITLTVIAAQNSADTSVLDRIGVQREPDAPVPGVPDVQLPPLGDGAPLLPPRGD
jgi:preprotein translocase subunit SecG